MVNDVARMISLIFCSLTLSSKKSILNFSGLTPRIASNVPPSTWYKPWYNPPLSKALERGGLYQGLYHVLGGTLDAIRGVSPEKLRIDFLLERVKEQNINEIILATSLTTAGQTTAYYILSKLT